jgi:hypothetical protein
LSGQIYESLLSVVGRFTTEVEDHKIPGAIVDRSMAIRLRVVDVVHHERVACFRITIEELIIGPIGPIGD